MRIPWSRRRYVLEQSQPGSVAVGRLEVPGIEPLTLVSVYGVFHGPVVGSMYRVIADLVPLVYSPDGARVIPAAQDSVGTGTDHGLMPRPWYAGRAWPIT